MSYNIQHLSTAGRATIFTIITGVFTFAVAFMLNLGASEFNQAVAQQGDTAATTSVTVVNLPPVISAFGVREVTASDPDTPTNSGDTVSFHVNAFDDNGEDYWLLVCSASSSPITYTGGATPPTCGGGALNWGTSAQTASAATATAATTTTETTLAGGFFNQENDWYAYVCDNNNQDPKCTTVAQQGPNPNTGATSSPFYVNNPPSFSLVETNSSTTNPDPVDPGEFLLATSTSVDTDNSTTTDTTDTVQLFICGSQSFDYVNQTCTGTELASTTVFAAANATATYQINIPTQDTDYDIFPYIIDNHGHAATSSFQGATTTITVDNVAPDLSSVINLASVFDPNNANNPDLTLTVEQDQTTGFRLDFVTYDANSCQAVGSTTEVTNFLLSIYRASTTGGFGSTTCAVDNAGLHDENDCYTSAVPTARWNLNCTASTTACTGSSDTTDAFSCTFPLWYIADPSDGGTPYVNSEWRFQIAGIDDDNATGTAVEGDTSGFELFSFLAFDLNTFEIPFGALAPGETTDNLAPAGLGTAGNTASSTILATGNVSIDEELEGSSMCPTFNGTSTPCNNSATSTIAADRMIFSASSTVTYLEASTTPTAEYARLSSTTPQALDLDVPKTTATSTPSSGVTYWGLEVPSTITRSGDYYGLNTFFVNVNSDTNEW